MSSLDLITNINASIPIILENMPEFEEDNPQDLTNIDACIPIALENMPELEEDNPQDLYKADCNISIRQINIRLTSIRQIVIIVIRNGKTVWKHGPYCCYFRLNLKYLGWPYRAYIKTAKNGNFWEELLSEYESEAVLATFCCYDHGAKASEAVQKIATD